MKVFAFLRSISFLSEFSDESLQNIIMRSTIKVFRPEDKILQDNQKGKVFGILMEGSMVVCRTAIDGTTQILAELKEKEYFGEMSLISGQSSSADIIGRRPGKVILVPQDVFLEYFANSTETVKHFAMTIANRLRYREDSIFPGEGYAHPDDPYGLSLMGTEPASKILVINSGSSSLKYSFYDTADPNKNINGAVDCIGSTYNEECKNRPNFTVAGSFGEKEWQLSVKSHRDALINIFEVLTSPEYGAIKSMREITAVGHRVVHGGERYDNPEIITDDVIKGIEDNSILAPLHNPINLMGIKECMKIMPDIPHVAVFDTAFHNKMPKCAYLYGIPYELYEEDSIRRYGFHGSSHHYVSLLASSYTKRLFTSLKIISCHLGNGASVCAIGRGRSVDTSMGLTPLEGLIMGTRSGDIDPAIMTFLAKKKGYTFEEVENILQTESGLKGISGISNDMSRVLDAAENGSERAYLAMHMFCYRVKKYIGAYIAILGGLDVLIFTGGIGEKSPGIRALICQGLSGFGIGIDETQNKRLVPNSGVLDISNDETSSRVRVLAIRTDESRMIARETIRALGFNNVTKIISKEKKPIPIGVSAHHVHLSPRDLAALFGDGYSLHKKFDLNQPGQYAAEETVSLIGPKGRVDSVRILGPTRAESQVEIARTEEFKLGIDAPVRESGDIEDTPGIIIEGTKGSIRLKHGVICAKRHIHMTPRDAIGFGLKDRDMVRVRVEAERPIVFGGTTVRVSDSFKLEMHVDTDEANAAGIDTGAWGFFTSLEERK